MKFTRETAWHWNLPGGIEGWAYGSKDLLPAASASLVHVDGRHGKSKSTLSDRVLYVLEGEGKFVVGDDAFPVGPEDVIVIPKNTPFEYSGKMKLFLANVPAYDYEQEVSLE